MFGIVAEYSVRYIELSGAQIRVTNDTARLIRFFSSRMYTHGSGCAAVLYFIHVSTPHTILCECSSRDVCSNVILEWQFRMFPAINWCAHTPFQNSSGIVQNALCNHGLGQLAKKMLFQNGDLNRLTNSHTHTSLHIKLALIEYNWRLYKCVTSWIKIKTHQTENYVEHLTYHNHIYSLVAKSMQPTSIAINAVKLGSDFHPLHTHTNTRA